jgi:hypothetical protein
MISYERFKELCESIGLVEEPYTRFNTIKFFRFSFEDFSIKDCAIYSDKWGMRVCSILDESNIGCWEVEECDLLPRFEMLKQEIKQIKMNYKMERIKKDFV